MRPAAPALGRQAGRAVALQPMRWLAAATLALLLGACGGGGGDGAPAATASPAPTGLQATTRSSSQIDLNWDAANGATSYDVYRSSSASPTAVRVASVSTSSYSDTGLFAGTAFQYQVSAGSSSLTAGARATTQAFTARDVRVGDPGVSYANVEFTDDNRYMVWFEQSTDGTGLGRMWHCGVDPDTGELVPADGRGFNAFDSTLWGRANPGVDGQGVFYVGADRQGALYIVRPTGPTAGTVTKLSTPADIKRRAIYPANVPSGTGYVFWILNSDTPGSGVTRPNDHFTLQYVSLAEPANIHDIETQPAPSTPIPTNPPMDIGFARWFRGKLSLSYGAFDAQGQVQVKQFDVGNPTPYFVTTDPVSKVDPWSMVYGGSDLLLPGLNATATTGVYRRNAGESSFALVETITPAFELANPALAQSNQSIVFGSRLYTAYQVNEQGSGFFNTVTSTGEIWLATVLQSVPTETQWLLSASKTADAAVASLAKSEPEPYTGNGKVWVFYSAVPAGANVRTATWQLRRADTPLGQL